MAGESLPDGYLELYKLAVEMADRISARRAVANTFLLAVQSGLVSLLGTHAFDPQAIAGGGLVLALAWWVLLRSYRDLNRAKFKVICDMEKRLPVQLFDQEWQYLKRDPVKTWRGRYAELGTVERVVPLIFALINGLVLAGA